VSLTVRPISAEAHRGFVADRSWASFLQTPAWAAVKAEWRGESIGWFDGDALVGVGLVLYRQIPRLPRYLAYLP
jgi:lipid II:glycine glycyltransferase (peptidoglycan interpeptide bridge formation enzyme)